jgi:hypothetical protein
MSAHQLGKPVLTLDLDPKNLTLSKTETDLNTSINKSQILYKISPNLTPNTHLQKLLDKGVFTLTTRSWGEQNSFDKENSVGSRSPDRSIGVVELDQSGDFGKKILKAHLERKGLEEQTRLMENRIKKLQDEDRKLKIKTRLTKDKTKLFLQNKQRHE